MKLFAAIFAVVGLAVGVSLLGCYLQSLIELPQGDPLVEEMAAIRYRYAQEMEAGWKHLPDGEEKVQARAAWIRRFRAEEEEVYRRYGRPLPSWGGLRESP